MFLQRRFGRNPASTLQGRREAEARLVSQGDRRLMSTVETCDRQLNLKVTPSVFDAFSLRARMRGMSRPTYLEFLMHLDQGEKR